ncbi:MAG: hypothetical protein MUC78_11390 [Bacteroidales bacterium]|jgi:hypothetical protein|nr:hypothetical protein [Bacteroidales bacterium]
MGKRHGAGSRGQGARSNGREGFEICDCRFAIVELNSREQAEKKAPQKSGAAMKRMEKLLLDSKKHLQSIMTLYLSDFTPCLIYYKYNNFISYNYF